MPAYNPQYMKRTRTDVDDYASWLRNRCWSEDGAWCASINESKLPEMTGNGIPDLARAISDLRLIVETSSHENDIHIGSSKEITAVLRVNTEGKMVEIL